MTTRATPGADEDAKRGRSRAGRPQDREDAGGERTGTRRTAEP